MSDYLPPEVLQEILIRLPAKSLLQFTCVSKSWYSLISSPDFLSNYTHFNSVPNPNKDPQLMIRHYSRIYGKELFTMHFDNDLCFGNYQSLDCPLRNNYGYLLEFVGSCNGLFCLSDFVFTMIPIGYAHQRYINRSKPEPIVVWNPSLGKSVVLPVVGDDADSLILGFGFDSKSIDYKVVRIVCHGGLPKEVSIFALSEDCWRSARISLPNYVIAKSPQALLNGNIHWIGYYSERKRRPNIRRTKLIVATFDVGDEVFGEFPMPNEVTNDCVPNDTCKLSIVVFGEFLSLIRYDEGCYPTFNRCCIWVMKEYGVQESWIKQYTISPFYGFAKTLYLRSNGEILLVTSYGELVSYDHGSGKVNRLKIYGETCSFDVDSYAESLVFSKGFKSVLGRAPPSNATSRYKA